MTCASRCGRATATIMTWRCTSPTVLAPRSLHWQALLTARAIENQAYVVGCNRVGTDGNGHHYRGDSRVISPQGEIIATAEPHQATRIDAEISLTTLKEYREKFPAWQDADPFSIG